MIVKVILVIKVIMMVKLNLNVKQKKMPKMILSMNFKKLNECSNDVSKKNFVILTRLIHSVQQTT